MSKNRKQKMITPEIMRQAVVGAFTKLDPRYMMKNPVMFVVEIGFVISLVLSFAPGLLGDTTPNARVYNSIVSAILFVTVLFANFAESVAEGRGKAQAASLKKTKKDTQARLLDADGGERMVPSSELKKGEGFTITIEVACYPEIEVKDYKGVEIEAVKSEVTDEDVENEIKSMARKNSRMVTVDRPAQDGDMVLIDYEGWVGDEQFEGGTAERQPLKLGSGTFIPGFEEQLIGVSTGESKDVKVTFPEEYHAADLAGKEAVFKCKVHEIKEEELPEINDEFVKDVSEFDTMDELREDTRKNLEKAAEAKDENKMKDDALKAVYEANDIDVPDVMVESEIDNMMSEFDQQLRSQGMDLEGYFKYLGTEPKDFRDNLREEALKKVKTRMIINAVADQENFEATDADVDQEIEGMAKQYGLEADKVKEMIGAQNIKMIAGDIRLKKAIDFIYDNAVKK